MNADDLPRVEQIKAVINAFDSLMWLAARQFSQWLQRTFGLTYPQFMALAALAAHRQACPMRELTSAIFEDPATLTGIIDRLVKMKLVQRTRSETDRRVMFVQATPAWANSGASGQGGDHPRLWHGLCRAVR